MKKLRIYRQRFLLLHLVCIACVALHLKSEKIAFKIRKNQSV